MHRDPGGRDDGFVHYHVKWYESSFEDAAGVGEVYDLIGATPAVELALWAYLADVDLVRTWTSEERPVDDVVRLAIPNQRAFSVRNGGWDEQWLRLLDVDAALGARTYGDAVGAVTIAVDDDLLPANTGVWSIDRNGAKRLGGVRAETADLAVDVAHARRHLPRRRALVGTGRGRARPRPRRRSAVPRRRPVPLPRRPVLRQLLLTRVFRAAEGLVRGCPARNTRCRLTA